jgi:hypothetical protein
VHFVPDDRAAADRALATGTSLVGAGDSEVSRALRVVADALLPPRDPVRRRRAGRARRR